MNAHRTSVYLLVVTVICLIVLGLVMLSSTSAYAPESHGSAMFLLPVRQYPNMESATIVIDTGYPGATQDVMQGFVTTPIAQARRKPAMVR